MAALAGRPEVAMAALGVARGRPQPRCGASAAVGSGHCTINEPASDSVAPWVHKSTINATINATSSARCGGSSGA